MTHKAIERMSDLLEMADTLAQDSLSAIRTLDVEKSESAKRQWVRALFAEIEGTMFGFKTFAGVGADLGQIELTEAERALVAEASYELTEKGEAEVRSARLRFAPSILFSFRMLARARRMDWAPPTDDNRWLCLRKASRVRDRLMHPKSTADLRVTDDEMRDIFLGYDWFWRCRGELLGTATAPPGGASSAGSSPPSEAG